MLPAAGVIERQPAYRRRARAAALDIVIQQLALRKHFAAEVDSARNEHICAENRAPSI